MMNSGMIVVLADATQNRGILKMGEESVALTGAAVEVRALPQSCAIGASEQPHMSRGMNDRAIRPR